MFDLEQAVTAAMESLAHEMWPIAEAHAHVPPMPGLYAVYGSQQAWADLGIADADPTKPLYVGKAEDSFVSRDLQTHFASGRTGKSTVRRSFAALLKEHLDLHGMPRNPANPSHFDKYALPLDDDERLTNWMWSYLSLALWPTDSPLPLKSIEREVVLRLDPPINIEYLPRHARKELRAARVVLANEARLWAGQN